MLHLQLTLCSLAASVLKCGKKKIWLDPNETAEIGAANSRQTDRGLFRSSGLNLISGLVLIVLRPCVAWLLSADHRNRRTAHGRPRPLRDVMAPPHCDPSLGQSGAAHANKGFGTEAPRASHPFIAACILFTVCCCALELASPNVINSRSQFQPHFFLIDTKSHGRTGNT